MADNRGYLGAEDGHLGDWAPHREKCKCADCQLDRLQSAYDRLKRDNEALLRALKELLPLAFNGVPNPSHEGSCGPNSVCDGICMDIAHCAQSIARARKAIKQAEEAKG